MTIELRTKDFDYGNSLSVAWSIDKEIYGIVFSVEDSAYALTDLLRSVADRIAEGKPGLVVTQMAYDNHMRPESEID